VAAAAAGQKQGAAAFSFDAATAAPRSLLPQCGTADCLLPLGCCAGGLLNCCWLLGLLLLLLTPAGLPAALLPNPDLSAGEGYRVPGEAVVKLSLRSKSLPRAALSRISSKCCTLEKQNHDAGSRTPEESTRGRFQDICMNGAEKP
jgi:hypothetical protein